MAALTVGLTAMACSTDDLFDINGTLGIDDGASEGAKESFKVSGDSEAKLELETGATLTVPKGAVDHDLTISVERPSDSKAIQLVESLKSVKAVASAPYVLTPHGTEFAKDVKLEIPVVRNKDRTLVVAWLKDETDREWKYLDSPTVENDVATVTLKHFSVVVLLDRARAGFEIDEPEQPEDAGESSEDRGTEQADAGADEPDASAQLEPKPDAVMDAGTSAPDAAVVAMTMDAAGHAQPDASEPVPTVNDAASSADAGLSMADASAASASDSSAVAPDPSEAVDTGSASDATQDADSDAAGDADADAEVPPPCTPHECPPNQCGEMADGCGGQMDCGDCSETGGGECGQYEPNQCPPPIGV